MKIPPVRNLPTRPSAMPATQQLTKCVAFTGVGPAGGQRVLLYGTGGIGKTTLACRAPGPVAFIDLDESLPVLKSQLDEQDVPVPQVVPATDWQSVRTALQSPGWDKVKTIVVDTGTKLEELAASHTFRTVKHEHGQTVTSIEGYGYGKGFQFVFDTFLCILGDLDRHVRAGRNVIIVAHDCSASVPNPNGEDWVRYEPRLQNPKSGNASVRLRMKEWCDHVLFLGYDVVVKNKKAQGSGTRTLYTAELPFFMAKSRTTADSFDVSPGGKNPWPKIIK